MQDQFSWTLWHLNFAAVVEKVEEKKERIRNGCRVLDKSDKCIYLCGCLQALAISRSIQNIWHHVRHRCQLGWYEKTIEVLLYTNLLEYFVHINMTLRTVHSCFKLKKFPSCHSTPSCHWMQHTPGTTPRWFAHQDLGSTSTFCSQVALWFDTGSALWRDLYFFAPWVETGNRELSLGWFREKCVWWFGLGFLGNGVFNQEMWQV